MAKHFCAHRRVATESTEFAKRPMPFLHWWARSTTAIRVEVVQKSVAGHAERELRNRSIHE